MLFRKSSKASKPERTPAAILRDIEALKQKYEKAIKYKKRIGLGLRGEMEASIYGAARSKKLARDYEQYERRLKELNEELSEAKRRVIEERGFELINGNARLVEKQASMAAKQDAELVGYDKYLADIADALKKQAGVESLEALISAQYRADSSARAQTRDPYAWGGMASGIAGPAAGAVTAIQTMQENARAEARAADRRAHANERFQQSMMAVQTLKQQGVLASPPNGRELKAAEQKVRQQVIDDTAPQKYFGMLKFGPHEVVEVTKGRSLVARIPVSLKEKRPLLSRKRATIDGAVLVKAFVKGELFATGYLVASGKSVRDFSKVGFVPVASGDEEQYEVLLVPQLDFDGFSEKTDFRLKYEPINIWAIQAQ